MAEPPSHALSRQDLNSDCIPALKVMETEVLQTPVLSSVFSPNTLSATQVYSFIVRGLFFSLRFFSLLGNANTPGDGLLSSLYCPFGEATLLVL